MGQTCKTCHHPDVQEIDKALLAGEPYRSVANQYEASPPSVYRHQQDHLPAAVVKAVEVAEVAHGGTLMSLVTVRTLVSIGRSGFYSLLAVGPLRWHQRGFLLHVVRDKQLALLAELTRMRRATCSPTIGGIP